jgi:hypothetical protein
VGWSRLKSGRGKLSGVSTNDSQHNQGLTQSHGECARGTPFINGDSQNPDLQVTLASVARITRIRKLTRLERQPVFLFFRNAGRG